MSTDHQAAAMSGDSNESLSATEQALATLWGEVLQIPEPPGPNEDFFELGGDSMTMVMTEFRITEEFSAQLPSGAMLHARTIRDLAALIDEGVAAAVHLL